MDFNVNRAHLILKHIIIKVLWYMHSFSDNHDLGPCDKGSVVTSRHDPLVSTNLSYQEQGIPLLIWDTKDIIIPFSLHVKSLTNKGHFLTKFVSIRHFIQFT